MLPLFTERPFRYVWNFLKKFNCLISIQSPPGTDLLLLRKAFVKPQFYLFELKIRSKWNTLTLLRNVRMSESLQCFLFCLVFICFLSFNFWHLCCLCRAGVYWQNWKLRLQAISLHAILQKLHCNFLLYKR